MIPASGRRRLPLDADAVFALWLALPGPIRHVVLSGCSPGSSTTSFSLPLGLPVGIDVFYAGISWDLTTGQVVSVTPAVSITTS